MTVHALVIAALVMPAPEPTEASPASQPRIEPDVESGAAAARERERLVRIERERLARIERTQRETEWSTRGERLRLHAGLSGAFGGALLLTGTVLLAVTMSSARHECDTFGFCELSLGPFIAGVTMFPLALIPIGTGIYWGIRLRRHGRERPSALLRPRVGGLVLHF